MPPVIRRIDFESALPTTETAFKVLFIADGFPDAQTRAAAARDAWTTLRLVAPFNLCGEANHPASRMFAVYCWTDEPPDLNVQQTDRRLSIPLDRASAIKDGLAQITIVDAAPSGRLASDIWPFGGRSGRRGSLVILLKNGSDPGELYELKPTDNYPVPIIGVVQTGVLYANLLARGVAQQFAGLHDEFELPGDDFLKATADDTTFQGPNVLYVSDERRSLLQNGDLTDLDKITRWPLTGAQLGFFAHQGNDPDVQPKRRRGGMALVEGGGGFRFNTFRCDVDCIMRRTPYSTTLLVQDQTQFCHVCTKWVEKTLAGSDVYNAQYPGFMEIDRQILLFDRVAWKSPGNVVTSKPSSPQALTATGVGLTDRKPVWRFDANVTPQAGLQIQNLQLVGREVAFDPFFNAKNVASRISFEDLSVDYTLDGAPATKLLSYSDAFADPDGVTFQVNLDGADLVQAGVKATFRWVIPKVMIVEAEATLVLRGPKADFDPGGVVLACKWAPQLAMQYRRLAREGKALVVKALKGTVVFEYNNIIPGGLQLPPDAPPHIQKFLTGKLAASLFTDSNSSDVDNVYDVGLTGGTWKSGRKLAGVTTIRGSAARRAHLQDNKPGLPHWSWLFDFVTPTVSAKKTAVATYHRAFSTKTDTTKAGKDGGQPRDRTYKWPLDADQTSSTPRNFVMTVQKQPRQGGFDNLHAAADHGFADNPPPGDKNATITPAPFCGDMCNHLHWRWGTTGISVATDKEAFLGWGPSGKGGDGANRVLGAPLVPPNQHIDVTLTPASDRAECRYQVQAVLPGENQWQVFLEQGLGFAFAYTLEGKFKYSDLALLATVFGLEGGLPIIARKQERDYALRELFDHIYQKIKFFEPKGLVFDNDETKPFILQTPAILDSAGFVAAPAELEDL